MATIQENLQNLVQSKTDIKNAIIRKGVEPEGGLETYADAIDKIEGDALDAKCAVTFNDDIVSLKVKMANTDITSQVVSEGRVDVPKITGDLDIKISEYMYISYTYNNATLSNTQERIPINSEFTTDIECDYGYDFDNVRVLMNSENITDSVFTISGKNDHGHINIPDVTGVLTIIVQTKLKTYNVTNNLVNASTSNSQTSITHGDSYVSTITASDHYALTDIKVIMNGEVITEESWDELDEHKSYNINIPSAIEDIEIIAKSKYVVIVTTNIQGATATNTQTKYRLNDKFYSQYKSNQYYEFTTSSCSDSSAVISNPNLDPNTRVRTISITINNLTRDVVIDIAAERASYRIENNLTNTTSDNEITNILEGESYTANLIPIQWYEVSSVTVKEGGRDITNSVYTDTGDGGTIFIEHVYDLIQITANSTNIVYTVTNNLTNISTNNSATTALAGQSYYELLTIDYTKGDDINIVVTMDGQALDYYNMPNGEINIPVVTGNIVVTASCITENLSQYNTLDHYTIEDVNNIKNGESIDVIIASPRIDHGYIIGHDGTELKNFGNGYKNIIRMQHEIAPVSSDSKYIMNLRKTQDTKIEDVYGPVLRTFSVNGSLYNSNITKLNSTISGFDLYGLNANLSIARGTTRTGTVTITFNGKDNPDTRIYARMYASTTGGTTNITVNGQTINPTTSTSTANINEFTAVNMTSKTLTLNLSANNNGALFAGNRNYNVYFLVPNNYTEIDVVGQQEVPDGAPYFAINSKLGNASIVEKVNIFNIDKITSANQTAGLLQNNNPCVFKLVRISDNKLFSSGNNLGPFEFESSESDKTVWYFYKPNTSGFSTTNVTITNKLTNATSSNAANSVVYGGSYNTNLNWDSSRTPYRLSVTMCGHDITDSVYNTSTKNVYIPCVIGPVVVTVACVDAEDMKKVTYILNDVGGIINKTGYSESMSTSSYDAVLEGDKYTSQPTFEGLSTLSSNNFGITIDPSDYQYMKIVECYAEMGGQIYNDIYDADTNTITIQEITDDCNITITALYIVGYVDDTYYDTDKSSNHIFVEANALGSGSYSLRATNIGEELTSNYNDITNFNI